MSECIHGMTSGTCSICLHPPTPGDRQRPPRHRRLYARFDSRCLACDWPILVGDPIESDDDDAWVHADCADGDL
jgi:hypothetical protein